MQAMLIKMGLAILTKLLTEKFLSKVTVHSLWFLSKLTSNKLDDKVTAAVAESLDVTDYK